MLQRNMKFRAEMGQPSNVHPFSNMKMKANKRQKIAKNETNYTNIPMTVNFYPKN